MRIIVDRYGCFANASRLRFCVYTLVHENNVEIIITPLGQKLPTALLTHTSRAVIYDIRLEHWMTDIVEIILNSLLSF